MPDNNTMAIQAAQKALQMQMQPQPGTRPEDVSAANFGAKLGNVPGGDYLSTLLGAGSHPVSFMNDVIPFGMKRLQDYLNPPTNDEGLGKTLGRPGPNETDPLKNP